MVDLKKIKSLIKDQWEEYRYSVEQIQKSSEYTDEKLYRFYLDRAKTFKSRAQGMEDLLYELGYFVLHCSDGTCVDIIERIDKEG